LAAGLGTVVGLALGECLARIVRGAPLAERLPLELIQAEPESGWGMVPDTDHFTYLHPVHVNNLGLRGEDVPAEKGDEWRVLCLGDSLVYGQGVANDATLPAHLQKLLSEKLPARKLRVLNGGVRAYATEQELGQLRRLAPVVRPDVVVLCWFQNDIEGRDQAGTYQRLAASGPITFDVGGRMEGSLLWGWRLRQVARSSALLMLAHDILKEVRHVPRTEAQEAAGMKRLDAFLAEFLQLREKHGFRLVFVVIPEAGSVASAPKRLGLELQALAAAQARGIETVDPLPVVRELTDQKKRLPIVPYDGHYDGEANLAMARVIAGALVGGQGGR
jgi:hypothetical protein